MKKWCILLVLFVVGRSGFADTIVQKNGEIQNGLIVSAKDSFVVIRNNLGILTPIEKSSILSIQFTSADIIFFKDRQQLQCKILAKRREEVVVITAQGLREIENSKIKTAGYCMGDNLTISDLPVTGRHFKNKLQRFVPHKRKSRNLYLGFSLDTHVALLNDWKEQYVLENDKNPATVGLQLGAKLGILKQSKYLFGLGYDYFFLPTLKVRSPASFDDKVSSQFFYLTGGLIHHFAPPSASSIYFAFDTGVLSGKETLEDSQVELEASGQNLGVRIKGGYSYDTRAGQLFFELGYLFGKVSDLELVGQTVPDYALDFSGLTISSGFRFLFTIH